MGATELCVCGATAKPEKFPKGKDVGISASVTTISCLGKAVTYNTKDRRVQAKEEFAL